MRSGVIDCLFKGVQGLVEECNTVRVAYCVDAFESIMVKKVTWLFGYSLCSFLAFCQFGFLMCDELYASGRLFSEDHPGGRERNFLDEVL